MFWVPREHRCKARGEKRKPGVEKKLCSQWSVLTELKPSSNSLYLRIQLKCGNDVSLISAFEYMTNL